MQERPRRILVVLQTPRDPQSAVFITYQNVAAELAARSHTVTILTPDDFPSVRRAGGRWTPFLYPPAVARWVAHHGADFDLAVYHSYAGWRAPRKPPAVVAFHGLEPLYHEALRSAAGPNGLSWRYRALQERFMPFALRAACRRARRVLCLNQAEARDIAARGWASADRVALFAHGAPPEFFAVARPPREPLTLLFLGQWLPMKGSAELCDAFAAVASRHSDLRLVCAGTLAGEETVLASFDARVRSRVSVLPRVDRSALVSCYRDADIFVFPSLYEGFGLAVVEAMATGMPIVTTAVGVAADALRDGESALVVPRKDPQALAAAIERLMADPVLRTRLAAGARAAAEHYREDDKARELADLLLDEARGASESPRAEKGPHR